MLGVESAVRSYQDKRSKQGLDCYADLNPSLLLHSESRPGTVKDTPYKWKCPFTKVNFYLIFRAPPMSAIS